MLELDPLDVPVPAQLDHRVQAVPGIVEEERALAADRLELVALRHRRAAVEERDHVAGEMKRAAEDPVGAGGTEPRFPIRPLGLAAEES